MFAKIEFHVSEPLFFLFFSTFIFTFFFPVIFQEDEIVPTIYSGLSEDDRFIGKLLAAQNFMMNIQTEVTKLIQDYMKIRQKDRKRKQKQLKRKSGPSPVKPPAAKRPKKAATSSSSAASAPKPSTQPSAPAYAQPPQPHTPIVQQGMLKTRKNNLTLEDGNRLKQQIASLEGGQQMTVLAILKENNEHLEQDDEGNVEMEFREFSQKSIDDLKDYVNSVLSGGSSSSAMASSAVKMSSNASSHQSTKNNHHQKAKEDNSDSEDESDSSSSSDSDSDSDSD